VAALGSSAAIGAGCVLTVDGARADRGTGWVAAAEVVAGAAAVGTTFSSPVRTVVVVLSDADPQRLEAPALELLGARRATLPGGELRPPTVVLRGSEVALSYAVVPDRSGPVTVRVRSGGDWRLAGVLGGNASVEAVGRLLVERGPLAVIQRILAVEAGPCQVSWQAPSAAPRKRAKKSRKQQSRRKVPAGGTPKRGK
jgi:hypothetical protein